MSSSPYSHFLDKLRHPQPPIQRFAVVSIFQALKSSPHPFDLNSDHGKSAISRCLRSPSTAVADQAVRELCRLVKEGRIKPAIALVELQSSLEGCDPRFVAVFVKAIGFLCRFWFKTDSSWGRRFEIVELHPFVKALSCRDEVQTELIQQVLLFVAKNRTVGMESVLKFLKPFLLYSVIRKPYSISSALFARELISSVASLSCSFPSEAIGIIKLLISCLKFFRCTNEEEFKYLVSSAEYVVDAFVVVLEQIVRTGMHLTSDARACGMEVLDTLLSLCDYSHKPHSGVEILMELSKRLLVAQRHLGLHYSCEFSMVIVSISVILTKAEFEHEHLSILKILTFLIEWKAENEFNAAGAAHYLREELLFVFPVISLLTSPSKSVKAEAAYLLSAVERHLSGSSVAGEKIETSEAKSLLMSKPNFVPLRLLHYLWFQEQSPFPYYSYLGFTNSVTFDDKETFSEANHWTHQLKVYLLTVEKTRVVAFSPPSENSLEGMSLLLSSIAAALLMHPFLGSSAVSSLVAFGAVDPKLGMLMLQAILFYNKMLCHGSNAPEILLKLLEMLPSLALNSVMVPLIVQTILPMLQKDAEPVLHALAIRLLCKTWIVTDRAFGTLHEVLDEKAISDFSSEREICISIAASVRDICRKNPDRGVDLILSVSSCIESRDSTVQALGFESLAHLCEADVVDFYTAWDVIAKHTMDYSLDPLVAHGLCTLLKWGALDAAAYPECSKDVMQILWKVATSRLSCSESLWLKARVSAFKSLSQYDVAHIQETIPDFKERNYQCLVTEDNAEVLMAMEEFEAKIIEFEHINRRRMHKEKRVMLHKVEKLLDIFPHIMFSSAKQKVGAGELPGAALLSLVFTPKDMQGTSKGLAKLHAAYEKALLEIAESLQIARNIFVALLALQSWKAFIHHWMKAVVHEDDAKGSYTALDKSSKAADDIFKVLCKAATESIPRVAVNVALAIGALCLVVPPSAHVVTSAASSFLLKWLSECEHEHRQWSAAISLGLISNCFHATDRKKKFEVINELLKVASNSKSKLIRGACGVGLGFSCQDLFTKSEVENSNFEGTSIGLAETTLLQNIVRTLSSMLCQLCPSASDSLKSLNESFLHSGDGTFEEVDPNFAGESYDNLEEDAWGIAGIVLGLGNSVVAIYKCGAYDTVLKLKDMLISWVPYVDSSLRSPFFRNEMTEIPLSIGSCLALPSVMAFCQRAELLDDDCNVLLHGFGSLISELLMSKKSGALHQNLLMASCVGAGSLLSCILSDGVHSVTFDNVKHLVEILKDTYTHSYPPPVHFGGMLGVVNAFGAGSGDLTNMNPQSTPFPLNNEQKETSFIRGPILSSVVCGSLATSVIQELFLIAKESTDLQMRKNAAWAVSFLRERWWSKELQNVNDSQSSSTDSHSSLQNFAEDSIVVKLCLWLWDIDFNKSGEVTLANTVSAVLRCLSKAPRLPSLDWGAIMRRCMRYQGQFSTKLRSGRVSQLLREECLRFSLSHANDIRSLLLFLDELTDLSRFRTLELNLQSKLLNYLPDLVKIFSGSKLEKLSEDLVGYFSSSVSSHMNYDLHQRSLLRVSFWKGLNQCLTGTFKESIHLPSIEKCMECLFCILPVVSYDAGSEAGVAGSREEWTEAIRCLSKARQGWLLNMLQITDVSSFDGKRYSHDAVKRISATARLARIGCIPFSELVRLKSYILNASSEGIWWNVLVDVVAALSSAEGNIKRQWLLDAVEISCMSDHPSTALRFIGLLSGSCCKYMPLLLVNRDTVLSDLPITLPSLLSESSWSSIAGPLAEKLWISAERVCTWAARVTDGGDLPSSQVGIDSSEAHRSTFLALVMHETCVALNEYLPFQKQLRLANLEALHL